MRKYIATPAATAAALGAGTALARKVANRRHHGAFALPQDVDTHRRRSVTVLRRPDELQDTIPDALAELGPAIQVQTYPAPGGRGTVLSARIVDATLLAPEPVDAVRRLRQALRQAKQQLEIGWTVTPTRSQIRPTPLNRPIRQADEAAQGEGAL